MAGSVTTGLVDFVVGPFCFISFRTYFSLFSCLPTLCSFPASLFTSSIMISSFFAVFHFLHLSIFSPRFHKSRPEKPREIHSLHFLSRHWWSASASIQSTDHKGNSPWPFVDADEHVWASFMHQKQGHAASASEAFFHSLVGVCWQAAASRWLPSVRLVPFTAGVLCSVVFS